jgi:HKD family nuclease
MELDFIVNTDETNHEEILVKQIKNAKEVCIAVAFLKYSGLTEIGKTISSALKKGTRFTVIAGQNFALTEPKALKFFFDLFKNTDSEIRLANFDNSETFHPKLYLFKNGNQVSIITGSANLTNGGLVSNYETSMFCACNDTDDIWKKTKSYYDTELIENSEKLTLLSLSRYERYFTEFKPIIDKSRTKPKWFTKTEEFNYKLLLKHLNEYDKSRREIQFKNQITNYKNALKVLNKMLSNNSLTKSEFKPLLDELVGGNPDHKYWTSGGLHRGKNGRLGGKGVYDGWKDFIRLVKFVKENQNKSIAEIFDGGKIILSKINGAGINYFTEILMTIDPNRFANMNRNPLTVLRTDGGVKLKATTTSYNGEDYEYYCELVKEIVLKLELKNMIEVDAFFNNIYWKNKDKK